VAHNNVGPLAGLKVIDLTHVMAGPVCTLLLADLGAEVIKIERPPEGDDSRHMAPPYIGEESAAYLIVNRHKRGIVLNLKHESGREALLRLLEKADVLVENYRGGTLEKLGLGYEQLRERFPYLVWCSISGWADRSLRRSARFRPHGTSHEWHHELHRRRARPAASQNWRTCC